MSCSDVVSLICHGSLISSLIILLLRRSMRRLSPLSVLTASSVLQCLACRNAPIDALRVLQNQHCRIGNWDTPLSSSRRPLSTSPHWRSQAPSIPGPSFTYRIGASFSAKGRHFKPKEDNFVFDPVTHKETYTGRPKSGQDAFFVSSMGSQGSMAFGVADGVGGWSDSGIDSAHFSHGLCQEMAILAKAGPEAGGKGLSPRALIQNAYNKIAKEGKIEGGGSTACVAVGNSDGNLQVAKYVCNAIAFSTDAHICSVLAILALFNYDLTQSIISPTPRPMLLIHRTNYR